jgi:acyl-CoA thioesterase I
MHAAYLPIYKNLADAQKAHLNKATAKIIMGRCNHHSIMNRLLLIVIISMCLLAASCTYMAKVEDPVQRAAEKGAATSMPTVQEPPKPVTIAAVGDSLTKGYGVSEQESYPEQLEQMLLDDGYNATVINMGVNGDTASGVLKRIDEVIEQHPDMVILEAGINDALQSRPPAEIRGNLSASITALQERGITVLLVSVPAVAVSNWEYPGQFTSIYPALAAQHNITLVPLLTSIPLQQFLGPDNWHPNEFGYRTIAGNILPYVEKELEEQ